MDAVTVTAVAEQPVECEFCKAKIPTNDEYSFTAGYDGSFYTLALCLGCAKIYEAVVENLGEDSIEDKDVLAYIEDNICSACKHDTDTCRSNRAACPHARAAFGV